MKAKNLLGPMAILLLCVLSFPFSAQAGEASPLNAQGAKETSTTVNFEYSDISLSDPSIYHNEPFTISLTVKNTGKKEAKHEVRLLLKDDDAPQGQRKQAGKFVALRPGQTETITFTFKASDLIEAMENMPEVFVFTLGEYEIGVGYEK